MALAIGGLFHVNFLLLGIGAFGLAELLADGDRRWTRLALLVAPQLVALAILAPEILAHATGTDPDQSLWVLVQFHAPLHYKPSWIARTLPSLLRWVALAVAVVPITSRFGERSAVRRLLCWTTLTCVICTFGTLLFMVHGLLPLTRLYIWRLAPFAVVGAQVVFGLAVCAVVTDRATSKILPVWRLAVAILLILWIAATTPFNSPADADWVLWIVVATAGAALLVPVRWRTTLFTAAAVGTLAAPLWYRRDAVLHPKVQIASEGPDTDALYAWALANTSVDAQFLVPPDLMRFRLVARRAIYVDFKSPPLDPDGLVEWHSRLRQLTGANATAKLPTHRENWANSTGNALFERAKVLEIDFMVLDRSPEHDRISRTPIYRNEAFAVFAISDPR